MLILIRIVAALMVGAFGVIWWWQMSLRPFRVEALLLWRASVVKFSIGSFFLALFILTATQDQASPWRHLQIIPAGGYLLCWIVSWGLFRAHYRRLRKLSLGTASAPTSHEN